MKQFFYKIILFLFVIYVDNYIKFFSLVFTESNKHPGSDEDDELCGPLLRVKLLATSDNFCDR